MIIIEAAIKAYLFIFFIVLFRRSIKWCLIALFAVPVGALMSLIQMIKLLR